MRMIGQPGTPVLNPLRESRERPGVAVGKIDELAEQAGGHSGPPVGRGKDIHHIDTRLEHIEAKLGIEE